MTNRKSLMACALFIAVLSGSALTWVAAQPTAERAPPPGDKKKVGKDSADPAASKPTKKIATHKVTKKPFKIELAVKGVLEPEEVTWIAYHPQPTAPRQDGGLTIVKVVEHGAKVRAGDLLVAFDVRRIDQAIEQLEAEIKSAESNIQLAELEQPLLEKGTPSELEAAERAKREADEDLAYFLKTGRPETEKRAEQYVKIAGFMLEFARDQLRQLEKMYKSNDLTEETEQMILKRQRFMVEYEADYYRLALIERDYILKTELPRREKSMRSGVIRQTLALERAQKTLLPMVAQRQQSLAKQRFDRAKSQHSLEMLRTDRAAMTITAPTEGLVYYGKFTKGHWEAGSPGKLVPTGTVNPGEVFMTIMKPRSLFVRLPIEEKDVHLVKAGLAGKAQMVFNPTRKLPARVTSMSSVPAAPGKFEAHVALDIGAEADLVPGLACSIKFVPYSQKQALVVPAAAVFEEDDQHFVNVQDRKGHVEQRRVSPGHTHESHTEILEGLREGEEILLERPGTKETAAAKGGIDP
jgi:HlyD family secretion protein